MSTKTAAKKAARKKKRDDDRAKREGTETVYVAGSAREVRKTQRFSMRGLPVELQDAAMRFSRDYESAFEALSAPAHGVRVDGGKPHQPHLARLAAQERVNGLRRKLGPVNFAIIEGVVTKGVTAQMLSANGGIAREDAGSRIREILRQMSEYYSGVRPRDKLFDAMQAIMGAAMSGSDKATLQAERAFDCTARDAGRN